MRRVRYMSLLLALAGLPAEAAVTQSQTIEFPCFKNLADGKVLVDGTQLDRKMQDLGYVLADGSYVPWRVLTFTRQNTHDDLWADGMCHMQLLPVEK